MDNSASVQSLMLDIEKEIASLEEEIPKLEKQIQVYKVMVRQKKQDLKKLRLMASTYK